MKRKAGFKAIEALQKIVDEYTPEDLERRANHVSTPTYPELDKMIENLTEEDMRRIQALANKILGVKPEPESQEKYTFEYDEMRYSLADYPFHIYSPPVKGDGETKMICIAMAHSEADAIAIIEALNNQRKP